MPRSPASGHWTLLYINKMEPPNNNQPKKQGVKGKRAERKFTPAVMTGAEQNFCWNFPNSHHSINNKHIRMVRSFQNWCPHATLSMKSVQFFRWKSKIINLLVALEKNGRSNTTIKDTSMDQLNNIQGVCDIKMCQRTHYQRCILLYLSL